MKGYNKCCITHARINFIYCSYISHSSGVLILYVRFGFACWSVYCRLVLQIFWSGIEMAGSSVEAINCIWVFSYYFGLRKIPGSSHWVNRCSKSTIFFLTIIAREIFCVSKFISCMNFNELTWNATTDSHGFGLPSN